MSDPRHAPNDHAQLNRDCGRTFVSPVVRRSSPLHSAFTLIEMLTVIAIIGIIAALSVPVLKNFGKSDTTITAGRQLLDDISRARQLAMSQRTTVYMVFVPTNFWAMPGSPKTPNNAWLGALNTAQNTALTNLLDKQMVGYTFMAYGALGDQPGQHVWHYLEPWQSLPAGSFIPLWKFNNGTTPPQPFSFSDPANPAVTFNINAFSYTNTFPFPTQDSTNTPSSANLPLLPYIAFNYLGQLSDYSGNLLSSQDFPGQDYDLDFVGGGVDIPLAQGAVLPDIDPVSKALLMNGGPEIVENPIGNSTNMTYNIVHIDPLTGRATLEFHKMP